MSLDRVRVINGIGTNRLTDDKAASCLVTDWLFPKNQVQKYKNKTKRT